MRPADLISTLDLWTVAALSGLVLSTANPAAAAEVPNLAVVGLHQESLTAEDQERAIAGLVEAIDATERFEALGPDRVAGFIRGRERIILEESLLSAAEASLLEGKNKYNEALPDEAVPLLQEAIDAYRLGIAATNTTKDLWEAWVYLGTSHLSLEQAAEARAAFINAVALNPDREPNPALFPPAVQQAYEAARTELRAAPVKLAIQADGPATVWVDGEEVGKSPVQIEVLPGEHHVVARGEGTQAYSRVDIEVPDPATAPGAEPEGAEPSTQGVRLAMKPPELGEPSASELGRSRQIGQLYTALGTRAVGLDLILVAGTDGGNLHLQLYHPATEAFSQAMEIPYVDDADDEAIQGVGLLLNRVDADGNLSQTSPNAAPLDIGANAELALLLTQPRDPIATRGGGGSGEGGSGGKAGAGVILGIVGGVVAAGAAGTGIYFATQGGNQGTTPGPLNQGTIAVQF
jgi:tetratricopeptide (TPR) repeat protein